MTSHLHVSHGEDGELVESGRVYVAPPDEHRTQFLSVSPEQPIFAAIDCIAAQGEPYSP